MKKAMLFVLVAALLGTVFLSGCRQRGELLILDANGDRLASLSRPKLEDASVSDETHKAYLEIVLSEAVKIVQNVEKCSSEKAERILFSGEYEIGTSFSPAAHEAIRAAASSLAPEISFGCALTDLNGNLCAAYSAGTGEDNINHASARVNPYSAFKPLSVYAPAFENKQVFWSDTFEDSPYKIITDTAGNQRDWPENADGRYSLSKVTVYEGLRRSLNTVAVKCLHRLGVNNSIAFLRDSLGVPLETEQSKSAITGEEEVIGNIAMGYLATGVSPVDMAGYYQIFANGGEYEKPHTVLSVRVGGETVYTAVGNPKRVIREDTAFLMNRLLQGVVLPGGTGEKAAVEGVTAGGKTGTGVTDDGNWFVGFTPQYSCAVWHGFSGKKNASPEIFAAVMKALPQDGAKDYPSCAGVKQAAYCSESGLLLSEKCRRMSVGWYSVSSLPAVCGMHEEVS